MGNGAKKKLPIGIEDFAKIRSEDFYYVDKTSMLSNLLQNWGEVNLFTRPRRFGKSLNMSMLKAFFDIEGEPGLFDGLDITGEKALCDQYMGQFPVIFISLKDVNGDSFATARSMMSSILGNEALRFGVLAESSRLSEVERLRYQALTHLDERGNYDLSDEVLMNGLLTLSALLQKHYDRKVMILVDEYDVPLAKANEQGYYDQMVSLMRNMFSRALKSNTALQFAVLTGCLRVAKESIFTGMNNLKVLSITDVRFDEYFGFTDREVRELLGYYGLEESYDTMKTWYDGYQFGNMEVYCPWDVLCYCDELRADPAADPKDYWSNTSGNDVVRHFIECAGNSTIKREIERLIAGEIVPKRIYQELTYKDLYQSIDHIWSVLFTTGYLTQRGKAVDGVIQLAIPNMEIRRIFTRQIMELFQDEVQKDGERLEAFCQALKSGEPELVEQRFTEYLKKTISIRDTFVQIPTKENFYHGILLGILGFKESWGVTSNRESGEGYSDILVEIEDEELGIVLEVKYAQNANLDAECDRALEQIEEKDYAEQLYMDGMHRILKYGIACYKKKCRVKLGI